MRLPFDVISDHYPWCPWIEPPNIENISETRVLSISQPGWKALVDLLCHGDQWNRLPCQQVSYLWVLHLFVTADSLFFDRNTVLQQEKLFRQPDNCFRRLLTNTSYIVDIN